MYVPPAFALTDPALLRRLLDEHPLATLVSGAGDELRVSHTPLLVRELEPGRAVLRGHLARANPQTAHILAGARAVASFLGPNGYVSPAWYASRAEVPTWNYVAAELHGALRPLPRAETGRLVVELARVHEARVGSDWLPRELPPGLLDELLDEVIGFELVAERVEGKLKLNQNRALADRQGVARHLAAEAPPPGWSLRDWYQAALGGASAPS